MPTPITTRPTLGWAALSRSALARAEAQLIDQEKGVRDEVGVLALHFGYANRFFPGTSVQHTRLRYALFVPWQVRGLLADPRNASALALEAQEMALALRLPDVAGEGTIGRTTAPKGRPVSIPPSQSYWNGLERWGILQPVAGAAPSRREVWDAPTRWREAGRALATTDDEHRPLDAAPWLFRADLPTPPRGFPSGDLDFHLLEEERRFLAARLGDVRRDDGSPSYLAVLVKNEVLPDETEGPWSKRIRRLADPADRAALKRARDAASLAAIARGVYQANVELLQEHHDGRPSGTRHREHLGVLVDRHAKRATRLDLDHVTADGVQLGALRAILEAVQSWLNDGPTVDHAGLRHTLAAWEHKRKGRRARLPLTGDAAQARSEWNGKEVQLAGPIDYRWSVVRRFLTDLHGAA